ncbi:S-adenosyl-L-methionine-dependent methyltransferase [Piedraia hortae CBS 480.64]|uniref:S-adenosyl-L-methionine-dependent methyltransferase n=1 Tax=Piedraia hortae CBS 480.64 TaxID=1314780 RepID=A0A6A7BW86_9PEZI|nr:S-adenosyl-L-methionine-dependent methyltransferase [Piedraia hortae CBS 480.64]
MSAFTETNRQAFNALAETYRSQAWQVALSHQVSEALRSRREWLGVDWVNDASKSPVRLLDYACGAGAITDALGSWVSEIRGIDLSERMVDAYNRAAQSAGLSTDCAQAVVGDLISDAQPGPELQGKEFWNFDVAAVGLGFHHFEDPPRALARLSARLKPKSGVLIIVDFLPFDISPDQKGMVMGQEMDKTIKHSGFTEGDMKTLFEKAGLKDFKFSVVKEQAVLEMEDGTHRRTIFIARGRKGGE